MTQEPFEGFRLSLPQRRVWRLQQESPVSHAQCSVLLTGNLDTTALQGAIQHVIQRHEILRTTFHSVAGLEFPLQVIASTAIPFFHKVNLCGFAAQEQAIKITEICRQEQRVAFDYAGGPLLRVALLALASEKHLLLISLPALCADAWTLRNLVQEIGHGYAAYPQPAALPEVSLQYVDFSAWQQDLLSATDSQDGRTYWHAQDPSGAATFLLPGMSQAAAKAGEIGHMPVATLAADELARLDAIAQQYGTSVAVCLLACWQLLLWRLTGQSNITLGYVCDGRKYAEFQGAMGLFAETVPVRGDFMTTTSWRAVVDQMHEAIDQTSAWLEYYPESSCLGTSFTAGFRWVEHAAPCDYRGVSFAVQQQDSSSDRFQLHLSCQRSTAYRNDPASLAGVLRTATYPASLAGGFVPLPGSETACNTGAGLTKRCSRYKALQVAFCYDSHCFREEDVSRLAGRLATLIRNLIMAPHTPISEVDILSPAERQQVLVAWNDTNAAPGPDRSLRQLLEATAASTPDAIAVVCEDACLTYQALHDHADQVAGHLHRLGVGPEVLVGIYLERSVDSVVAILGVLKAGGVYVPLDPAYPHQRLAFMLNDAQVQVLLTRQKFLARLPAHNAQVLCMDAVGPGVARHSTEPMSPPLAPHNLAYVMYTSGSTGEPRGVMITQANVSHYVQALQARLGITADDRYLHTASVAFSSSIRQLLLPLAHGATIVMASAAQRGDPLALCQAIKQQQVTVLDILPSYWRNLTQALDRLPPASRRELLDNGLRLLMSASEALASDVPQQWAAGFQHQAHLLNMFGQTETTGIVAVYPIPPQGDSGPIVPIGRPVVDTQLYLLDMHLRPVPIGVSGELCVAGKGLGRGYLRHPALTAQKFLPHPFSTEPGARLYMTGDHARHLPDGTLAFLGRIDQQVKIRGVRIEPGEIAALLSQHPSVAAAVVVGREERPGADRHLVAYVVPREESGAAAGSLATPPAITTWRDFLQQKLPEYMVPTTFVPLTALPLTPNGKIDRQALPAPSQSRPALENTFVAPRTPVEAEVARIWAEVLRLDQIGMHDNFFQLGGHSLLAAQVIYRLRETFLMDLPLPSLFAAPTVAGVAAVIGRAQSAGGEHIAMARALADIEQLSADDVQALLAVESQEGHHHDPAG